MIIWYVIAHIMLFLGVFGIVMSVLSKDSMLLKQCGVWTVIATGILNTQWVFNPLPVFIWTLFALFVHLIYPKPVVELPEDKK